MFGENFVNSSQVRVWVGQHPPTAAEYATFNKTKPKFLLTKWANPRDDYFYDQAYKAIYINKGVIMFAAPVHKATGNLDVIVTSNMQQYKKADLKFYYSRTHAASCRSDLVQRNFTTAGYDSSFLIEARAKANPPKWPTGEVMSAGGDFFYADFWGGDTCVQLQPASHPRLSLVLPAAASPCAPVLAISSLSCALPCDDAQPPLGDGTRPPFPW